ncbi:hypothetical protein FH972_021122 [Carpinus fangiana]|uniref:Uncharacterized protein n=1 Tax=Carpinus fangiana TaxID=176857 RepID=A0A5N6KNT6_9ROSI|nr:hypothetical protein FH972_021122 [Carpinus fangiana]
MPLRLIVHAAAVDAICKTNRDEVRPSQSCLRKKEGRKLTLRQVSSGSLGSRLGREWQCARGWKCITTPTEGVAGYGLVCWKAQMPSAPRRTNPPKAFPWGFLLEDVTTSAVPHPSPYPRTAHFLSSHCLLHEHCTSPPRTFTLHISRDPSVVADRTRLAGEESDASPRPHMMPQGLDASLCLPRPSHICARDSRAAVETGKLPTADVAQSLQLVVPGRDPAEHWLRPHSQRLETIEERISRASLQDARFPSPAELALAELLNQGKSLAPVLRHIQHPAADGEPPGIRDSDAIHQSPPCCLPSTQTPSPFNGARRAIHLNLCQGDDLSPVEPSRQRATTSPLLSDSLLGNLRQFSLPSLWRTRVSTDQESSSRLPSDGCIDQKSLPARLRTSANLNLSRTSSASPLPFMVEWRYCKRDGVRFSAPPVETHRYPPLPTTNPTSASSVEGPPGALTHEYLSIRQDRLDPSTPNNPTCTHLSNDTELGSLWNACSSSNSNVSTVSTELRTLKPLPLRIARDRSVSSPDVIPGHTVCATDNGSLQARQQEHTPSWKLDRTWPSRCGDQTSSDPGYTHDQPLPCSAPSLRSVESWYDARAVASVAASSSVTSLVEGKSFFQATSGVGPTGLAGEPRLAMYNVYPLVRSHSVSSHEDMLGRGQHCVPPEMPHIKCHHGKACEIRPGGVLVHSPWPTANGNGIIFNEPCQPSGLAKSLRAGVVKH